MKNAIIMSAKYAPGHFSHMLAYSKLFESVGFKPVMLIDEQYQNFKDEYSEYTYETFDNIDTIKANVLLIYNMSIHDSRYINIIRSNNPNVKILFVYHEPWFGYKKWIDDLLKKNESLTDSIKTLGRFFFCRQILKKANLILLPSKKSVEYYKKICIKYNKNFALFPLVFTDESNDIIDLKEKKYFSFISTVQNSKNFSLYIKYIKEQAKKDCQSKFQIATRSDITKFLDEQMRELIKKGQLIVNYGHPLSNAEINEAYRISNCTWMLYNRSTQSGVICKSFMFGTPVIASDIGGFRDIVDEKNGIILNQNYTFEDIEKAYKKIIDNLGSFSIEARKSFYSHFFCENQKDIFLKILYKL